MKNLQIYFVQKRMSSGKRVQNTLMVKSIIYHICISTWETFGMKFLSLFRIPKSKKERRRERERWGRRKEKREGGR